jgi:hypothetical protein
VTDAVVTQQLESQIRAAARGCGLRYGDVGSEGKVRGRPAGEGGGVGCKMRETIVKLLTSYSVPLTTSTRITKP